MGMQGSAALGGAWGGDRSLTRPRFCCLQSKEGKSPLHMAAIHGRFTRSQILIQNGEWLLPILLLCCSMPPPGG